jgi:hypothetical protein
VTLISQLDGATPLGEYKTAIPNNITNIDHYITSTNVARSSFITKLSTEATRAERLLADHTRIAGRIYVGRSAAPTIRERDRVRNQIAQEKADKDASDQAFNERIAALQASLPATPTRAPRGRRDR